MFRIISIVVTFVYFVSAVQAQTRADLATIADLKAFTRFATRHDHSSSGPIPCIHTMDLAREHLRLWQQWHRTRRWPSIADRYFAAPKVVASSRNSVVRISWYPYEDSAATVEVDTKGRMGIFGTRYDIGPDEAEVSQLKPQQMLAIRRLMQQLPPSRSTVRWSNVLIISGRRDNKWFVRMYRRDRKPESVQRLLQMLMPKTLIKPLRP